jgi:hypothetical protein
MIHAKLNCSKQFHYNSWFDQKNKTCSIWGSHSIMCKEYCLLCWNTEYPGKPQRFTTIYSLRPQDHIICKKQTSSERQAKVEGNISLRNVRLFFRTTISYNFQNYSLGYLYHYMAVWINTVLLYLRERILLSLLQLTTKPLAQVFTWRRTQNPLYEKLCFK